MTLLRVQGIKTIGILFTLIATGATTTLGANGTIAAFLWDATNPDALEDLGSEASLLSYSDDMAVLLLTPEYVAPPSLQNVIIPLEAPHNESGHYYLYHVEEASRAAFEGQTRVLLRRGRTVLLWSSEQPPRLTEESVGALTGLKQPVRISLDPKVGPGAVKSARKVKSSTFHSLVEDIVLEVEQSSYTALWQTLDDFETRYFGTPENQAAAQWIYDVLESYGLDVQFHEYAANGGRNVVGTLHGIGAPEKTVYMTAHFDSISMSSPSVTTAPGTDDNASGVAAFLEAARVMSAYQFYHTVRFVGFNGEEIGHLGSQAYVPSLRDAGEEVIGCFNLDQIAHVGGQSPPVRFRIFTNPESAELAQTLANACRRFVPDAITPSVFVQSVVWSDHYEFWLYGYKAVVGIEGTVTPWYHTAEDRIEKYPKDYATHITRATVAAVAQHAIPVPDVDCNENGTFDYIDMANGQSFDCNANGIPDECDIAAGELQDCNKNNIPDTCEVARVTALSEQILIDGGGRLHGIVAGDFNEDGAPDLAATQWRQDGLVTLLNDGTGTFTAGVSLTCGESPQEVAVADLGSGHLDVVVANATGDTISLFRGRGDGTFEEQIEFPAGDRPRSLVCGDFNGDGYADVAVSATASRTIEVFLNDRTGGLGNRGTLDLAPYTPADATTGDMDGDGDLDIVICSAGLDPVLVLANNGSAAFSPVAATEPVVASSIATGDLDNDGDQDVAVVGETEDSAVFVNDGNGMLMRGAPLAGPERPVDLMALDVDNDHSVDLVAVNFASDVLTMYENFGDERFVRVTTHSVGTRPRGVAAADFDGDGRIDLAVANDTSSNVSLLMNATTPGIDPDCNNNGVPDSCDIAQGASADVDGDGIPDECFREVFRRGDANADGAIDISDAVNTLGNLFLGQGDLPCDDAADANDDGGVDISDAVYELTFLFLGGPVPPTPHGACGPDPTEDALSCASFPPCE